MGDVDDRDDLDEAGDVDDLDAAGDGARLAAGVVRDGELCALASGNGHNASIAMAMNEAVNFMTTLSVV